VTGNQWSEKPRSMKAPRRSKQPIIRRTMYVLGTLLHCGLNWFSENVICLISESVYTIRPSLPLLKKLHRRIYKVPMSVLTCSAPSISIVAELTAVILALPQRTSAALEV
jgi:hypothetical protein